jgi:hypothetical protein
MTQMSEMTYMSIIQNCQVFTYEYVMESGWRWASIWSIPRRRPGKSTRACGVERVSNVSSREPNTYGLVWDDYLAGAVLAGGLDDLAFPAVVLDDQAGWSRSETGCRRTGPGVVNLAQGLSANGTVGGGRSSLRRPWVDVISTS